MCNNCGNVGWTIEVNAEGVEYIESCFECFVEAHEEDHCPEDERGHEYEFAAHRCTHCNQVHPDVREAA